MLGLLAMLAGCPDRPPRPLQTDQFGYGLVEDPLLARMAAAPAEPTDPRPDYSPPSARQADQPLGTLDRYIALRLNQQAERPDTGAPDGPPAGRPTGHPDLAGTQPDPSLGVLLSKPAGSAGPAQVGPQAGPSAPSSAAPPADPTPRLALPPPSADARIPSASSPTPVTAPAGRSASAPDAPPAGRTDRPHAPPTPPPPARDLADAPLTGAALNVAGRIFTADDILRPIWGELDRLAGRLSPAAHRLEALELIGNQLRADIAEHLVLQEAEKGLNEQGREAVDKTLADMLAEQVNKLFGGSERLMRQKLQQQGLSFEKEKDRARRQLLVRAYLREKFRPQIHVTRPEAYAYYQKRLDEFTEPARVRLRLIEIKPAFPALGPVSETERLAAEAKARQRAAQILAQLRAGTVSFEQAARRDSDDPRASSGGDWGFVGRNSMRARKVEEAAFALRVGQISDVIEDAVNGQTSWFIIEVTEARPLKITPFSEAVATIIPRIEQQKFAEESATYMAQLYRQAGIDERQINAFLLEAYRIVPKPAGRD